MAKGVTQSIQQKEEMIKALRPYLQLGMTVNKACRLAELPSSTITDYIRQDELSGGTVRLKINTWRNQISTASQRNIAERIHSGDVKLSKWWLTRTKSFEKNERELEKENIEKESSELTERTKEAIKLLIGSD